MNLSDHMFVPSDTCPVLFLEMSRVSTLTTMIVIDVEQTYHGGSR